MRLGHFISDIGRIELYHDAGRFETRSTYTDAVDHVTRRECPVPQSRSRAWDWYMLCDERGATFAPFPVEVAA